MQLACSDESLACSVGLRSTPSRVIRATVEGREILSAANGSAAVEDNGDTCVVTTWAASASDVCAGSASRLAHGDGRLQLRGQPLSFSGYARPSCKGLSTCSFSRHLFLSRFMVGGSHRGFNS
jgi:hypothetical protein